MPTWDEALDDIGADAAAQPAHVLQLGEQIDYQGIIDDAGDGKRDRVGKAIGHLTRYLVKDINETYGNPAELTGPQLRHMATLHHHVRWLPCSPECCNWLRFGVQPKDVVPGMAPGECPAKAHDRHHLGIGGRRVLVSRQWTGKTLTEHRADRAAIVRATLTEASAGTSVPIPDELLDEMKHHLAEYAEPGESGRVFVGAKGGRLRRQNFRKMWLKALAASGVQPVHFHDLRHTGNQLAADRHAALRELMERMGHSIRAPR